MWALVLQQVLGWGGYQTAWTCLRKLRLAMHCFGAHLSIATFRSMEYRF